jgi:nicotinamide riboside transporter PnuC
MPKIWLAGHEPENPMRLVSGIFGVVLLVFVGRGQGTPQILLSNV